jgi:hypothetical protein
MKRILLLLLIATRAYSYEYVDGWLIQEGQVRHQIGSWVAAVSVTVLNGQSADPARLYREQKVQTKPARIMPKPRPRLGQRPLPVAPQDDTPSYTTRVEEASAFVLAIAQRFADSWNEPHKVSEAAQWVHEIDADLVFDVNIQNGAIAVESLASPGTSAEMEKLRQDVKNDDGSLIDQGTPTPSDPAETTRLRDFVRSLAPLRIPDSIAGISGASARFHLLLRVAKVRPPAANSSDATSGSNNAVIPPPQLDPGIETSNASPQNTDVSDPAFQYTIGRRYLGGAGLPHDPVLAEYWLQKSAEQNYVPAQLELGIAFNLGRGTQRDPAKALFWYKKAAENGSGNAMYNIGCMYQNGDGVERDTVMAATWERKAATMGYAYAQRALSFRYLEGDGVEKDPVQAFKWCMRAAHQGDPSSEYLIGKMYEDGIGTPKDSVEALAWYNLSPKPDTDEGTDRRQRLEATLGPDAEQAAAKRAAVLREQVHAQEISATH